MLYIEIFRLGDPLLLLRISALQRLHLLDLVPGIAPGVGINVSALLLVLIEHEAGEGRFGAGYVGVRIPDDERNLVGVAFVRQCFLAGVVGEFDQKNHGNKDEGRNQARGSRTATPPVKPDVLPHHEAFLTALTFWRKPGFVPVPGSFLS